MKILFIVPGSGDSFYCGNCFRDNLHASALRKAGHDITIMPLYLPLKHPSFQADTPLFFPATTFYTAQRFFSNRKMPKWLERLSSSVALLDIASSMSGTTSAKGTEAMTLSMITGDGAAFQDQINQMLDWMKGEAMPDIIHLSSSLLIGIAKKLRQHLNIPIVCSVQDEEVWLNQMNERDAFAAWHGIMENSRYIDRFITTSQFYKEVLKQRIPQITAVDVIYPGIDRNKYSADSLPKDPVIGFFYRMNRENGLDILVKAFIKLKEKGTIPNLRLKIAGGYTGKDKSFLKEIKKMLSPYKEEVEISDTYSLEDHAKFYSTISLLSVPITFEEGVGLYLCEAFAAGRPAVEPSTGSFPEIVREAGILYQPNTPDALAEALEQLLTDKELFARCESKAVELSATRYNDQVLSDKLLALYEQCANKYI
ncbi:MAG: glycosyltransferase family 4 protein [Bacteroidales bacterium]|nr:glycosyltransferase family 4 protein [Bacteroidales bacterium]